MDYKGRGFSNMKKRNRRGETRRLVIVSNKTYADVERNEFRQLEQQFAGTIMCWEHRLTLTQTHTARK